VSPQPAEFLTVPGRLIPRVVRRWADRVIRTAVDGIEAWERAHDQLEGDDAHDWMERGTPGDEWRECFLCGLQEDA
jgi:hypothetical protein